MARTVPPLRRLLPALAALLVAAGAAALTVDRDDGPPAPDGVAGYRLAYDVADRTTGTTAREVVEVVGLVSRRLLPGGGGTATTASGVYDRVDGGWRQLAAVPPGETGSRLQLTSALSFAEGARRAARDGTGTVAGLACDWWLTREPLDVAPFAAPTAADRTRSCVDADGRLLADSWTAGGRELRRRTAVEVEPLGSLDPFDGTPPAPLDPRLVSAAVEAVDPPAHAPPPGCAWTASARTVEGATGTTDVVRQTRRDVAECGGRLVVLDRVRDAGGPAAASGDEPIDVGAASGRARATGGGLVVELVVGEELLRVRSGIGPDAVVPWLAGLAASPP